MTRILVTGASGFIGRRLVRRLATTHQVIAVVRTRPAADIRGVEWLVQDLASERWSTALPARIDSVIHLAQSARYRDFPAGAPEVFAVATAATAKLLDWAVRAGARRFILASTGGVYGSADTPFSEDAPAHVEPGALALYFAAKRAAELIVGTYSGLFTTVIMRFFFVYGSGQSPQMLMPRLVDAVRCGRPISLQGEEGIRINPVHVDDAVAAVEAGLGLARDQTLNVAGPDILPLRRIAEAIGAEIGRTPAFAVDASAKPRHLVADIGRMSAVIGAPAIGIAAGIREMCGAVVKEHERL